MKNCTYYYNESGSVEIPVENMQKIGDERALDGYLYDHRDDFVNSIESIDVTLELKQLNTNATQDQTKTFIQQMDKDASRWNGSVRKVDITAIWDSVDPDQFTFIESFNDRQRKKVIDELKDADANFDETTPEGQEKLKKKLQGLSDETKWIPEVGNVVGKAFEIAFKQGVDALDHIPVNKNLFPTEAQSINFYNSLARVIKGVINELNFRFPGAQWLTEQSIFTNQITDKLLGIMSSISGKNISDIAGILGRVDITGILPDGSVITIELKTSSHRLPSSLEGSDGTYPRSTLARYSAQVLTYDIIRKQHGIKSTPYLLNIHRTDDGSISFDKLLEIPAIPGRGRFESIVSEGLPLRAAVEIESLEAVHTEMAMMFGNNVSVASELQTVQRDINYFLDRKHNFVKDVTDAMPEAKRNGEKFYFVDHTDSQPRNIFAKTEEELKEKIKKYLEALDKMSASAWVNFAAKFKTIKTVDELRNLLLSFGYKGTAVSTIVNHLSKYIQHKWELVNDPALIANGMLVFRGNSSSEIVMLEEIKSLLEYHQFANKKNGTTILGKKYGDFETGSGNRHILSSQYGNLLMIKAMSIISRYPKLFDNCKIAKISAINPRRGEINDTTMNSTLLHNWKLLTAHFKELNLKLVDHVFMDDVEACILRAQQYVKLCEDCTINNASGSVVTIGKVDHMQVFKLKPDAAKYTYEDIVAMRKALIGVLGGEERSDKMDSRMKNALDAFDEAILAISRMHIYVEKDNPEYFDKGFAVTGSYMTPFYRSTSANLRLVHEISDAFHYKMTELIQKYTTPFQLKLAKALKKNENYRSSLGGEYVMSEEWFVKDNDGRIDKSFRLKPPTDPYFNDRPEERELLEYVLETFAALRWPGKNVDYLKSDEESEYYQMPLFESDFVQSVVTSETGISGAASLLQKRIKRTFNNAIGLVMGQEVNVQNATSDEVLNQSATADPFEDPKRDEKLKQYGPDAFTKNIDEIFLYTTIASMKRQVSETMLPMFNAVRHLLHRANEDNKSNMDAIEGAIKQYIGTVIFDKAGVKSNLIVYQKLLQTLRQLFSVTTLGLNPKALTRDTISSSLRSAISFLNGKDGKSLGISADEYFEAFWVMSQNMDSIFKSHGYWNQLNLIHQISNMSYREIAEQLKTNKYALGNVDSSFFFLTTTAPDYLHRMSVLKAYLDKIGASDAYVADENGMIHYDMTKDKRWEILYKYKSGEKFSAEDRAKVPEKERDAYDSAWIQYVESIESWKKSMPEIRIGDNLPLALDPTQEMNIRAVSNNMYGAYDKDAQALVNQTLLGGAFFQFKTYGLTRLIDWWRAPGQINILQNTTLRDDDSRDKEEWYEVINTPEEVEQTGEYSRLMHKSEVPPEKLASGMATPLRVQNGALDEGRVQSTMSLLAAGWGQLYGKTQEERDMYKHIFGYRMNDPMTRLNILRAMLDTFSALLIYGFIRIAYPEEALENMNDQDWWTRWSYAVSTGVASDGPIWSVFNSIWGGGQIPVITGVSRWMTSAWSVLNGDQFAPALFNTFGATRELSNMFTDLN